MSDDPTTEAPKPKKKGGMKKVLMLLGVGTLVVGGAAAAGAYVMSAGYLDVGAKDAKAAEPKKDVKYVSIENSFTANVLDTEAIMQVSIGVSTTGGEEAANAIKKHELPIRSAVLMTLAEAEGDPLLGKDGKTKLRKALAKAINEVLKEKAGEARVDAVYFTSFLIQ